MVDPLPSSNSIKWVRSASAKAIPLDAEGFLLHIDDWDEEVARELARADGVKELSRSQWAVIRFLREFYLHYGKAPLNHKLKAGTGMSMMKMEAMFPFGIKDSARRWAGLPKLQGGCR